MTRTFTLLLFLLICIIILYLYKHYSSHPSHSSHPHSKRIIHLVLFSPNFPYHDMMKITRSFYQQFQPWVTTIYYCFDPTLEQDHLWDSNEMILRLRGTETYVPGILLKTLLAIQFATTTFSEFDYIVRSNVSTIVDFRYLFLEMKEQSFEYGGYFINDLQWIDPAGGVVDETWFGTNYASGTCILIGRNLALKMVSDMNLFRTDLVDDLSIGVYMKEHCPHIPIWTCSKKFPWFYRNRQKKRANDLETMQKIIYKINNNSA